MSRRAVVFAVVLVACSRPDAQPPGPSDAAPDVTTGQGGAGGGAGGAGGGAGGEGGALPPKPVDCAKINPGITCVEDDDCPLLSKPQLDACGPWSCAWSPPPDPDAGIAGKKRCEFQPKP